MAEERKYCIKVPGALVEVSEDVYLAYFRARRRWSAQSERDIYNGVISYDSMDTEEILGEEYIPDYGTTSVEDAAITNVMLDKLRQCLTALPEADRELIYALYFQGLSERQFSARTGVHHMTIHCRKKSILRTLKKLLEN